MKASTENKASTGNIFAGFSVAGIEKSREEGGGGAGVRDGAIVKLILCAQSECYSFMLCDSLEMLTVESK